ncbi:MAG TPA: Eco57I restriction-modification methylase domain-containing protein [Candidatus Paceibacterota bacterium]|nr:Eco57I restriction-modification methylase domain-containing protein [Candidatus Paceibacterota bacterium]
MKLNEKYNPESFLSFIQDFLPEDLAFREEDIVINKDRYKEITKARILGFCESLDLHVLEMDHTHDKDPRVAIATDAFKILADHWIHRALVIFKNNDSDNYRFSYLTITLDLNDKNKVVKRYSSARRYSFYLGSSAKVRTPEQQLIKKGRIKDVDDLLNRFSVEVVNKQFYLEVAKFFDELVSVEDQNLILPGVSETDINTRKSFAVRLIGRIMFCWFLKQKKSDNGQLIPDEILSSKVVSDNYYHSVLEPLFFGVLNTSIDARDIRTELFDKVPYLNGGLFNPQNDDYYELDRGTFASRHINTLKVSDKWFKEFFELLETYNFTIDENTVFDQELSVDPEMLGRIFENLLAEINPETGSSERKRTGSFYTPRQIVEYMVDQSLIEYFKTKTNIESKKINALVSYDLADDAEYPLEQKEKKQIIDAIESLKILDPACGSGAYPIGALQKIVYILQQVDPDCTMWLEKKLRGVPDLYKQKIINEVKQNPFDYTRKLDVIKNSIFGVDIQPIAVDVSRLRCFLTIVVESKIDDTKSNRGIDPLPNLDFKFVCANTLIDLPKIQNNNLFEDHSGIVELSTIMSEYFTANYSEKESIKTKFFNKQKVLLNRMIELRATGELTLKLTLWNPFSNESNPWFDPGWMFGLEEKFDVVIGNPPYFVYQGHSKGEIDILKKISIYEKSQGGKLNAFKLFLARGSNLLKNGGLLDFIFQNSFLADNGSKKIRQYFLNDQKILHIDSFPERDNAQKRVFESVKMSVCIMLSKNTKENEYSFNLCVWDDKNKNSGWNTSFTNKELLEYDPVAQQIPYLKEEEKDLFKKFFLRKDIEKIKCYEGELNMTFHKHLFTQNKSHPMVMKGAQIQRYYVTDDMSQGQLEYLDENKYLETNKGEKSTHHNFQRIAIQGISGVNDKVRIISSLVGPGIYLANSCNYVVNSPNGYSIYSTLGVLNSKFINYIFKKTSTNSNVNTYEISNISFIKKNEQNYKLINDIDTYVSEIFKEKSKNIKLSTKSVEEKIDELVMDLYGLNDQEKEIIRKS